MVLLVFVVVILLLFVVLFPLPFWDLFPFFFPPLLPVLEELDAAANYPLKKSVAPFDRSINDDNEFKSPTVLSVTS